MKLSQRELTTIIKDGILHIIIPDATTESGYKSYGIKAELLGGGGGDLSEVDHNLILNTHNLTDDIDHDLLYNYVSNQHIDWTNASENFHTSGTAQIDKATTISGTLTVNGDIIQNGAAYETHAEKLYTSKDLIFTRDGAVGGLASGEYTGIQAKKYDGANDGLLVFDAQGWARVGDVGSLQKLATIEENPTSGYFAYWDGQLKTKQLTISDIAGFNGYSFSNGLTEKSGSVKLGGILTSLTTLSSVSKNNRFVFSSSISSYSKYDLEIGTANKPFLIKEDNVEIFSIGKNTGVRTLKEWIAANNTDGGYFSAFAYASQGGKMRLADSGGLKVEIVANGDSYFKGGNVGIGKNPSLGTLDVNGSGYFSNTVKATDFIIA